MKLQIDPREDADLPGERYVKLVICPGDEMTGWISFAAVDLLTSIVIAQGGTVETVEWVKAGIEESEDAVS